jgi:hypothetical protein
LGCFVRSGTGNSTVQRHSQVRRLPVSMGIVDNLPFASEGVEAFVSASRLRTRSSQLPAIEQTLHHRHRIVAHARVHDRDASSCYVVQYAPRLILEHTRFMLITDQTSHCCCPCTLSPPPGLSSWFPRCDVDCTPLLSVLAAFSPVAAKRFRSLKSMSFKASCDVAWRKTLEPRHQQLPVQSGNGEQVLCRV